MPHFCAFQPVVDRSGIGLTKHEHNFVESSLLFRPAPVPCLKLSSTQSYRRSKMRGGCMVDIAEDVKLEVKLWSPKWYCSIALDELSTMVVISRCYSTYEAATVLSTQK